MWLPCSDGSGWPWTSQWSTTPSPATASTSLSPFWGWATLLVPWWVPPPDQVPPPWDILAPAQAKCHQISSFFPGVPSAAVMEVTVLLGNMWG